MDCEYCQRYKAKPQSYTTKRIGSRNSQTIFHYGETESGMELQVVCGCFRGNLEEFEKAVEKTHGGNEYGKAYRREIEKVRVLFNI